jgi:hypothetical protein
MLCITVHFLAALLFAIPFSTIKLLVPTILIIIIVVVVVVVVIIGPTGFQQELVVICWRQHST